MLHIVNGDEPLAALRVVGLEGRVLVWREMLCEGPPPKDVFAEEAWAARAQELERLFAVPASGLLADIRAVRRAVADEEEEIVLWFEEDLFCHVNLLHLLDLTAKSSARVSLVLPTTPLGRKTPIGLSELFDARRTAAKPLRAIAARALRAWRSDDPRAVEHAAMEPEPAWPLLAESLAAHVGRFPSKRTGLGTIEEFLLRILASGPVPFSGLLARYTQSALAPTYGFGDFQIRGILDRLRPLVSEDREGVRITALGARVLAGEEDRASHAPFDGWLGGVRLAGRGSWRRDGAGRFLPP